MSETIDQAVAVLQQKFDGTDIGGTAKFFIHGEGAIMRLGAGETLIPLGDTSGLAVTVARYLTPSGRDIQNQGIEPDVVLPQPEPLDPGGEGDSWLEQTGRLLAGRLDGNP